MPAPPGSQSLSHPPWGCCGEGAEISKGRIGKNGQAILVIMGGSKVSDKIGVIKALMEKDDTIMMAGNGEHLLEARESPWARVGGGRQARFARESSRMTKAKGVRFLLPVDALEAEEFKAGARKRNTGRVIEGTASRGLAGSRYRNATIALYEDEIAKAKTILSERTVGVFEIPDFAEGKIAIGRGRSRRSHAVKIIGGGDRSQREASGLLTRMTLFQPRRRIARMLEGKELPGVAR